MGSIARLALVLAALAILIAAPAAAGDKVFDAPQDSVGLLVVDLNAHYKMMMGSRSLGIDFCEIVAVLPGGSGFDMNHMVTSSAVGSGLVFAGQPGYYRLFIAQGYTMMGTSRLTVEIPFPQDSRPELTVEIRRGEVAYLGTVNVESNPKRESKTAVVADAERQQKLLLKLADNASKTPWGPVLLHAASTERVAADMAAARARAAVPAKSLPASRQSLQTEEARQKAQSESVTASASRAPVEGRHPEDRLLFIMSGSKQGLIDTMGRVVVEPEFDWTSSSTEGRAMVARNGLSGYVDGTGRMVIEPKWQSAYSFVDGLAMVETGVKLRQNREIGTYREGPGQVGWIDRDGNVVIAPQFAEVRRFSEGLAWVSDGKRWGLIDRSGQIRIGARFEREPGGNFSGGLCPVWLGAAENKKRKKKSEEQFGYIDASGVTVIPAQFGAAASFSEGAAAVMKGGKVGFIDRSGRLTIEPRFGRGRYGHLPSFSEGLAAVNLDGRYGFVDSSGQFAIEPRFQTADQFHDGLALVVVDGKFGYIDKAGHMVIAPQFDRADSFVDGIARVEVSPGLWGYIRRDGTYIWNPVPTSGR